MSLFDIFPTPEQQIIDEIKKWKEFRKWMKKHKTHGSKIKFPRLSKYQPAE